MNLAKATKHHWPLGPDFLLQVQNPVRVYRKATPVQGRPMDGRRGRHILDSQYFSVTAAAQASAVPAGVKIKW